MKQYEWPAEWTAQIGRAIRHARGQAGLSAEGLSRRCSELGVSIPRNTISNLENGRKASVPLHEVVTLAAALGVAPVELMAPFATAERVQFRPEETADAYELAEWISGNAVYMGEAPLGWDPDGNGSIAEWRSVSKAVSRWLDHSRGMMEAQVRLSDLTAAIERARADLAVAVEVDGAEAQERGAGVLARLEDQRRVYTDLIAAHNRSRRHVARDVLEALSLFAERWDEHAPRLDEHLLEQVRKEASDGQHPEAP